jgi:hypothetical protein
MTPDDIPLPNPADEIPENPKPAVGRAVGAESETRGGREAPDETLDGDLAGGPSDPPAPPAAPPEQPPDPDKPPPIEEPPRPIPVPPDEPPPPLIATTAASAGPMM